MIIIHATHARNILVSPRKYDENIDPTFIFIDTEIFWKVERSSWGRRRESPYLRTLRFLHEASDIHLQLQKLSLAVPAHVYIRIGIIHMTSKSDVIWSRFKLIRILTRTSPSDVYVWENFSDRKRISWVILLISLFDFLYYLSDALRIAFDSAIYEKRSVPILDTLFVLAVNLTRSRFHRTYG